MSNGAKVGKTIIEKGKKVESRNGTAIIVIKDITL